MPLFMIRRSFPGATETDLDAAAFRALACAPFYEGLLWVRSFWDRGKEETLCFYEARSVEDIRLHADRAQIPCDEICAVEEVLPSQFEETGKPLAAVS
jgi:hypothetical protein